MIRRVPLYSIEKRSVCESSSQVGICLSQCRLCTPDKETVLSLRTNALRVRIQKCIWGHITCAAFVSNTIWTCNFLFHLETVQYFWPTFWSWCIATFLFRFFSPCTAEKTLLRVSPSWDIYCQNLPPLPPPLWQITGEDSARTTSELREVRFSSGATL